MWQRYRRVARLSPGLFAHLFFGHRSSEGGHAIALEKLGVRPILDLGMRLGEGTGAALAMSVVESIYERCCWAIFFWSWTMP